MLITAWGGGASSFAQRAPASPEAREKIFTVGYLLEGSDIGNANARMEELRRFLLGRREVVQALKGAGFSGQEIVLSPCETPYNMVQRMNDQEFHLVFSTAIAYARTVIARQNGPAYEPILQLKLPGDIQRPDRDGVLRQGVIFVGPNSPLFAAKGTPTKDELRALLAHSPLAVPSADSAAGYLSPRHIMAFDLGLKTMLPALFCNSDSEVVKHVVSGMAEVGACREGALKELGLAATPEKYYKILWKTDPLPTDPILLRSELMPIRSPLGVRLKAALREFFGKPELSVANTSARDFEIIVQFLNEAEQRPAEPAAKSAPHAPAAPTPTPAAPTPTPAPVQAPATPAPVQAPAPGTPAPQPALPPMITPGAPGAGHPAPAGKPAPEPEPAGTAALPPAAGEAKPALPPAIDPAALATPAPRPALPALPQALPGTDARPALPPLRPAAPPATAPKATPAPRSHPAHAPGQAAQALVGNSRHGQWEIHAFASRARSAFRNTLPGGRDEVRA